MKRAASPSENEAVAQRLKKEAAAAAPTPAPAKDNDEVPEGFMKLTEGSASMLYECRAEDTKTRGKGKDDGPVFYNKVQVFNRDVSVLVMALFAQWRYIEKRERQAGADARKAGGDGVPAAEAERARLYALSAAELDELLREDAATGGLRVLDALAATGLRSVRYAKEVPGVKKVVSNDIEAEAAKKCQENATSNGCESLVEAVCGDAVAHMINSRGDPYDVIDLDPYGSAAPFLDGAVQAISDGGSALRHVDGHDRIIRRLPRGLLCEVRRDADQGQAFARVRAARVITRHRGVGDEVRETYRARRLVIDRLLYSRLRARLQVPVQRQAHDW